MKEKIYKGNIVICKDLALYNDYGKYNQVYFNASTDLLFEDRSLIKVGKDKFVDVTDDNIFQKKVLHKLGIYGKVLKTYPTDENMVFIDEDSLFDYFDKYGFKLKLKTKTKRIRR